jgi:hypothetical protein
MADSVFISSCSRRELARRRSGRPGALLRALAAVAGTPLALLLALVLMALVALGVVLLAL